MKTTATATTASTTYKRVSKNICKTGKSYRVRVCGKSCTCRTQREAYATRKVMIENAK